MAQKEKYDLNSDGEVDVSDVTKLVDVVLTGNYGTGEPGAAKRTFYVNGKNVCVSFNMIAVEGGTFMMGATPEQYKDCAGEWDEPWYIEKPVHEVTLSSYYIGETEVTQELWEVVMGWNLSETKGLGLPVEQVSWDDCQRFFLRLNELTGYTFRLPTEAEWEYAARGGNKSKGYKYSGSDDVDEVAWYTKNSISDGEGEMHPVGTKKANELGIYDMSGNVSEWCRDWYGPYSESPATDPTGPTMNDKGAVRRGGCYWYQNGAWDCRVSCRGGSASGTNPGLRMKGTGFRLVL
ncbi:MAG: SUMF1/EgtB/PvdO family nonheme iron enzyme [Alloprevotella sp.]|nr:SUMF1/EgtB/PvdO family nonheme iron enzyme [Alloprevotella sp.]